MKFGRELSDHAIPEWRKGYIDYRRLKKLIKKIIAADEESIDVFESVDDELDQEQHEDEAEVGHRPTSANYGKRPPTRPSTAVTTGTFNQLSHSSAAPTTSDISGYETAGYMSPLHNSTVSTNGARFRPSSRPRSQKAKRKSLSSYYVRQPENLTLPQVLASCTPAQLRFFEALDIELEKVNSFYEERKAEAISRYATLSLQTEQYLLRHAERKPRQSNTESNPNNTDIATNNGKSTVPTRHIIQMPSAITSSVSVQVPNIAEINHQLREPLKSASRSLKLAIFEYYRFLGMLKNYCNLNRAGFSKILKKFEKWTDVTASVAYMEKVNNCNFVDSRTIEELITTTENLFAQTFTKGSRKRALERLRVFGSTKMHHFSSFRSGTMLGLAVPVLIDGIHKSFQDSTRSSIPYWAGLLQLFGAFLLPVLFSILFSLNLLAWYRNRINYTLIFEFDMRKMIDFRQYLEIPTLLLVTLCYAFWLSFSNFWPSHIDPWVYPVIWLALVIFIFILPLPVLHPEARWWFLRSLTRVFTAGLLHVEFRDFFLGDQLVSLYYPMYNIGFLICAANRHFDNVPNRCSTNNTYVSAVLASLPSLLRLGQSIRRFIDSSGTRIHLLNAGKYSASVLYYFFYFHWRVNGSSWDYSCALFVVFAAINSIYSLSWDILLDWNLLKPHARYKGLRHELGYHGASWVYYLASVLDFIGRFTWVWYLAPAPSVTLRGWIIALIEIIRRWIWNFFRVESEHVGNIDGFRVTRDVPLPYVITTPSSHMDEESAELPSHDSQRSLAERLKELVTHTRPSNDFESDEEESNQNGFTPQQVNSPVKRRMNNTHGAGK